MPIYLIDKIKHANGADPVVDAADVQMPDGSRLSDFTQVLPVVAGAEVIEPEKFYDFGAVSELAVELAEKDDGKAHEYWFRFEPTEGFAGLTIAPEVKWVSEPQYPAGKRCTVGILMGTAVMAVV